MPTGCNVLVVDSDPHSGYLLKGVLMAAEQEVTLVHDADEALAQARRVKPDLLVVDASNHTADAESLVELLRHDPDTHKASILVVTDRASGNAWLIVPSSATEPSSSNSSR